LVPLHEVTGPIFNVPDRAPLTTKEFVAAAEALPTGTIIGTNPVTNSGTANRATLVLR